MSCPICSNPIPKNNKYYCSNKCRGISMLRPVTYHCITCNKPFVYSDASQQRRGKMLHCSEECKFRKYSLNEYYFDVMTPEVAYTLGILYSIGYCHNHREVKLYSSQEVLSEVNRLLGSSYPIQKSSGKKYKIRILSSRLVLALTKLGLGKDPLYFEFPSGHLNPSDFISGFLFASGVNFEDGVNSVHMLSHKLALEMCERLGGKIYERGGEYVILYK